jgi:hypothetical protein
MARKPPTKAAPPTLSDGQTRGPGAQAPGRGAPSASPLAQAIVSAVRGRGANPGMATKGPARKGKPSAPPRRAQGPGIGGLAIGQRRRGGGMPPPLA